MAKVVETDPVLRGIKRRQRRVDGGIHDGLIQCVCDLCDEEGLPTPMDEDCYDNDILEYHRELCELFARWDDAQAAAPRNPEWPLYGRNNQVDFQWRQLQACLQRFRKFVRAKVRAKVNTQ